MADAEQALIEAARQAGAAVPIASPYSPLVQAFVEGAMWQSLRGVPIEAAAAVAALPAPLPPADEQAETERVTYTLTRADNATAGDPCVVCGAPATQAVNVSTGNWSTTAQMQARCDKHGMREREPAPAPLPPADEPTAAMKAVRALEQRWAGSAEGLAEVFPAAYDMGYRMGRLSMEPPAPAPLERLKEELTAARADREHYRDAMLRGMHALDEIGTIRSSARADLYHSIAPPSLRARAAGRPSPALPAGEEN